MEENKTVKKDTTKKTTATDTKAKKETVKKEAAKKDDTGRKESGTISARDNLVKALKGDNNTLLEAANIVLMSDPKSFIGKYFKAVALKNDGNAQAYDDCLNTLEFEGVNAEDQVVVLKHFINSTLISEKEIFKKFLFRFADDKDLKEEETLSFTSTPVVEEVMKEAQAETKIDIADWENKSHAEKVKYLLERKRIREEIRQAEYEQRRIDEERKAREQDQERLNDRLNMMKNTNNYYENEVIMAFNYLKRLNNVRMPYHLEYLKKYADSSSFIHDFKRNAKLCDKIKKVILSNPKKVGPIVVSKDIFSINPMILSIPMMKYFVVDPKNEYYSCNAQSLFSKNGENLISYRTPVREVSIEKMLEKVKYIEDLAFAYREDITEVIIPNGVLSIGEDCFRKCTHLKTIIIPTSVQDIGRNAFAECPEIQINYKGKNIPAGFQINWCEDESKVIFG